MEIYLGTEGTPIATDSPPHSPSRSAPIIELAPLPIIEVRGSAHLVSYVNSAFCRLLGKTRKELLGKCFAQIVPGGDQCAAILDRVYQTGEAETYSQEDKSEPNTAYWLYAMWPALDANEHPERVIIQLTKAANFPQNVAAINEALLISGLHQHELTEAAEKLNALLQAEIAERKVAEEALRQSEAETQRAREEAEAANRAKDIFLATLSHEIRTPLNSIVGWAFILQRKNASPADFEEGMRVIDRNCRLQAQLIDDVLDVSRIVSGKLRLDIQPCDLSELIKAAVDTVRPSIVAKEITLDVNCDPVHAEAASDVSRMQQVIWNLLNNAVKFTPKGGKVAITLTRDDSAFRITVTDSGQGIDPEFLPYVFDRFRQADSGSRRKLGGLGLGLSIVKHIVELHGGRVEAQSAGEGRGATFCVTLPIRAAGPLADNPKPNEPSPGVVGVDLLLEPLTVTPLPAPIPHAGSNRLGGVRVLVVDDEPDTRRLLKKVLEMEGASVVVCAAAAEALRALQVDRAAAPHIVVSDLGMPEMDGLDLIREVRRLEAASRDRTPVPAVALTGFAHTSDAKRALDAGFQVHVSKPVDPERIIRAIADLARRIN
jgi:signal transduction histidine kinase/ActR/RegA family two-component response regulator